MAWVAWVRGSRGWRGSKILVWVARVAWVNETLAWVEWFTCVVWAHKISLRSVPFHYIVSVSKLYVFVPDIRLFEFLMVTSY